MIKERKNIRWRRLKRKVKHFFKYPIIFFFLRILIGFTRSLSRERAINFYCRLASIAFSILKRDRNKTINNIKVIYGESMDHDSIKKMARNVFMHQARNLADYIWTLHVETREEFLEFVNIEGEENLKKAYDQGKGVLCLICHMGSWEFSAITPSLLGFETTAVSKALKDERLNKMIIGYREKRGMKNLSRGKTYPLLIDALNKGECLIIMIDQDTKAKSIFVDFMGKSAYTPIGAALLALDTEAAVVPMAMKRLPDNKHQFTISPEIDLVRTGDKEHDIRINTQNFSKIIEEFISEDPEQWVWMHERWRTTPENYDTLKESGLI
jgi:Kdo2-lipid IVA lauroyltransferase/acyltransferase